MMLSIDVERRISRKSDQEVNLLVKGEREAGFLQGIKSHNFENCFRLFDGKIGKIPVEAVLSIEAHDKLPKSIKLKS